MKSHCPFFCVITSVTSVFKRSFWYQDAPVSLAGTSHLLLVGLVPIKIGLRWEA